ncbi:MAG TPA: LPS export ABC transporter ATP-binding protein [Planctomycetota bacterium]|nr:LPS export ABC transporter ATP-binding protein [Planctomycetota bacterium]
MPEPAAATAPSPAGAASGEGILLATENLRKTYGKREVVRGVSLQVRAGEIVGLLGKNGAGKTTTFSMVVGLVRPSVGEVRFMGKVINRLPMYRRARLGIGYLPQESSVFQKLSVSDNLLAVLETMPYGRTERLRRRDLLLEDLSLSRLAASEACTLSGGERRRLEVARALALKPRLMLFDEPFSGIDPITVGEIQAIIRGLRANGIGILLTDHNVRETISVTDHSYLIDEGVVFCKGTPQELATNDDARRRYLGENFFLIPPPPARPMRGD